MAAQSAVAVSLRVLPSQPASRELLSHPPRTPTMTSTSQRQKGHDRLLSTLDGCIQVVNLAKDACGIPIAQTAFASVGVLLTVIRVRFPHSEKTIL